MVASVAGVRLLVVVMAASKADSMDGPIKAVRIADIR